MVLTRAQRAQTNSTAPASPPKSGALSKAPARRGRKKAEPEEEPEVKAAPKTTKATKGAATTTTAIKTKDEAPLRPASRIASTRPAKAQGEEVKAAVRAPRAATGTTKSSVARAVASKPAAVKSTVTREAAVKTTTSKAATAKAKTLQKIPPAAKSTRAARSAKAAAIEKTEEPSQKVEGGPADEKMKIVGDIDEEKSAKEVIQDEVVHKPAEEDQVSQAAPTKIVVETIGYAQLAAASGDDNRNAIEPDVTQATTAETQVAEVAAPSKLPVPISALVPPVSPFKSSILVSSQVLGSIRKPAVTAALFTSPTKAAPLLQSATKPLLQAIYPARPNTSIHDFAGISASPRRPTSAGSDSSADSRASTPKRPYKNENSVLVSQKRLRTSTSMPSLGLPQRSQRSDSDSPPSPAKSSIRSPVKKSDFSPKKVSWHQTPPRPAMIQETTPPARAPGILDGCIFFLDVNSLTGSNQNSLFAGLIEELGGQYVQHWTHNNMGITHVLFMNGEMRTLEKVLASNEEVYCVSLGWLLDCQREDVRIPENQPRYLVDLTHVPGHTPKPNRSALNTPTSARTAGPASHTPAMPPPKWTLPTTPAAAREPLGTLSSSMLIKTPAFMASMRTPAPPPSVGMGTINEHDKENVSPVSDATPLVQKTCPPKQLNKSIFAISTGLSATPLRSKLLASKQRRRSLDGAGKPGASVSGGLNISPRRPLELGSPKRRGSPLKKSTAWL